MAKPEKKYKWLRLYDDFFCTPKLKKIRKIAGGETYTIIYLKLMLLTINDDGYYYYEGIEDSLAKELALTIDEDVDNVQITINYMISVGLAIIQDDNIYIPQVPTLIGTETAAAERMRRMRERKKESLPDNNDRNIVTPLLRQRYTAVTQSKSNNNNNNITTTEEDVVVFRDTLTDLHLGDDDVAAIASASGYDIDRCRKAISLLKKQTKKINNVTGWLIDALQREYTSTQYTPPQRPANSFCAYEQRDYDYEELETFLQNT